MEEQQQTMSQPLDDDRFQERDRIISLLGFNHFGTQLVPLLHDDIVKLGGGQALLAVGITNVERPEFSRWRVHSGVRNLSPTPKLFAKARAISLVRDSSESVRRTNRAIAHLLVNELIQTYGSFRAHGALVVLDDLSHIPALVPTLEEMKSHLPQHSLVVSTAIPEPDEYELSEQQEHMQSSLTLLKTLKDQGVIDATILTHLRSSAFSDLGRNPSLKLLARSLSSLIAASCQRLLNPTFPEVIRRCSALSPYIGLAAGTARIATGQPVREWRLLQKLFNVAQPRGSGDVNDAMAQSKRLTHEVLEQERSLVSPFAVDISQPFYEVYLLPFQLPDPRFSELEDVLSMYLSRQFPKAVFLAVSGNGAANSLGPGYYCQTSTFYPLQPQQFVQFGPGPKQLAGGGGTGTSAANAPHGKSLPEAKKR